MAAWLQSNVNFRAVSVILAVVYRVSFGVKLSVSPMVAAAYDSAVLYDYSADHWIGISKSQAFDSLVQSAFHIIFPFPRDGLLNKKPPRLYRECFRVNN